MAYAEYHHRLSLVVRHHVGDMSVRFETYALITFLLCRGRQHCEHRVSYKRNYIGPDVYCASIASMLKIVFLVELRIPKSGRDTADDTNKPISLSSPAVTLHHVVWLL